MSVSRKLLHPKTMRSPLARLRPLATLRERRIATIGRCVYPGTTVVIHQKHKIDQVLTGEDAFA
ncbi:hypothetical protein [Moorena producens]|uniref:hypothetical protein n=1 Tax=Moorena producens TaxID=1155739 RepID=UPI0011EA6DB2|nr:hypothetical protein [Moorena producens]